MPNLWYFQASDFSYTSSNGVVTQGLPSENNWLFGGGVATGNPPFTITLNPGATGTLVVVTDNNNLFQENVPTQTFDNNGTTTHITGAYSLYQNANYTGNFVTGVHTFTGTGGYDFTYGGPVQGLVSSFQMVPGVPYTFLGNRSVINNAHPYDAYTCFTKGSLIDTANGRKAIEDIEVGDLVWTRDNGMQPVRWIGSKRLSQAELVALPEMRPVLFRKGSCGNDHDLAVSPEHRMFVTDANAGILFGTNEMLVPAKYLIDGEVVVRDTEADEVIYYHVLFDKHEIVRANGALSESFHPAQKHTRGMDEGPRRELFELFPELRNNEAAVFAAARPILKSNEFELLKTLAV